MRVILKIANYNTQRYIGNITNVIPDIKSINATYNCIINSTITDIANMTNDVIKNDLKNDCCSQYYGYNLRIRIFKYVVCEKM